MTMPSLSKNFFYNFILESEAYRDFSGIEKLIDEETSFSAIPFGPLYLSLKDQSLEIMLEVLPKLDEEQRQCLLDLEVWNKDQFHPEHMDSWIQIMALCRNDEVKKNFLQSDLFLLYLKKNFEIQCFDPEEGNYPEHDYFFVTEDQAFIFIYKENFSMVDELKSLIKDMYYHLGVETSYMLIMQLDSESVSYMEEQEYQAKEHRIVDFGMMGHYHSLELLSPLINQQYLKNFIQNLSGASGELDDQTKNQTLHPYCLYPFKKSAEPILNELSNILSLKRQDFLKFNFVLLVNALMSIKDAYREGQKSILAVSEVLKKTILFGLDYLKNEELFQNTEKSIFEKANFIEVYRIGGSLYKINQQKIKEIIKRHHFDNSENKKFMGEFWNNFLENSFEEIPQMTKSLWEQKEITDIHEFRLWDAKIHQLDIMLPYIAKFHQQFLALVKEGRLHNSFYLNYEIETIDFEAIILSSFAHFIIGSYSHHKNHPKLGLTLEEFKKFVDLLSNNDIDWKKEESKKFAKSFGLHLIPQFEDYFIDLIKNHLDDLDFSSMSEVEFRHVGGPIILNSIS